MRTQWIVKGNRDAGSSCLCDRGLHRYLRNFGGGLNTSTPPRYATETLHSRMEGGGRWCGSARRQSPKGGEINIVNLKNIFSALKNYRLFSQIKGNSTNNYYFYKVHNFWYGRLWWLLAPSTGKSSHTTVCTLPLDLQAHIFCVLTLQGT